MYGPAGDLLPGQLVNYTIAYENVGEGTAFGVFIVNKLPDGVFDLATLQIGNGGSYSAGSKSITWDVGDLAPKGQDGAKGTVAYSVRLRSDLPSGTIIPNQAVVHFPSVPEETPTNRLTNVIQPLVAEPQSLTTEAGKPIAVTLSGRDAVGHAAHLPDRRGAVLRHRHRQRPQPGLHARCQQQRPRPHPLHRRQRCRHQPRR